MKDSLFCKECNDFILVDIVNDSYITSSHTLYINIWVRCPYCDTFLIEKTKEIDLDDLPDGKIRRK